MKIAVLISLVYFGLGLNPHIENKNMLNAIENRGAEIVIEKVFVNGTCGMCKSKIERIASKVKGVRYAVWDLESKILEVKFNTEKTNLTAISTKIADAGYDTKTIKATEEAYNNLHHCCKYKRE